MKPSAASVPDSAALRERAQRRASWRTIAVLTTIVGAVHLALLGAVPMPAGGPRPSPVVAGFITRTLVVAPPVAPRPEVIASSVPQAAVAAKPAKAPRPQAPARPRAVRPAPPAPAPIPSPPSELSARVSEVPAAVAAPAETSPPPETAAAEPAPDTAPAVPAVPSGPLLDPAPLRVPASVRLRFAVTGQQGTVPMQGVFGELAWSQDGQAYDARLTLRFLFKTLRTQHSSGAIGPTGIEPARFSDTRKTEVASHFVRDQAQVVFSNNAPGVPLMAGAQDRLSVMLQLGALLAGDPARYPVDGAIAVQTVGPRDADIWIFKIGAEEKLDLPAGEMQAIRLTRNPRRPFDDTVELWLAPSLGYLPVRIKLMQPDGDFADMQLREHLPGSEAR